jgi:hypothetical protein
MLKKSKNKKSNQPHPPRKQAKHYEMELGKMNLSFYEKDTLLILVGDNGEDMTMLNSFEAQQLVDFIQTYLDSFKKSKQ